MTPRRGRAVTRGLARACFSEMSSASSPFVSNFWSAADTEPPGHAAGLSNLRSWIRETQEPVACNKRCTLAYAYHGGALADVRRLAFALMYALVNDCHLVGRWPMYKRGGSPFPKLSTLTTSPELRRRCYAEAPRAALLFPPNLNVYTKRDDRSRGAQRCEY